MLTGKITIVGMILLTATVNLVVGLAFAKWVLISPILVPMLMAVGSSTKLTKAAYRVGDSPSNIITQFMVFFPLVVVYCQQYVKSTGIGTLLSMMLPYSLVFLVSWTALLGACLPARVASSVCLSGHLNGVCEGALGSPLFFFAMVLPHSGGAMNQTIDLILSHRSIRKFTAEAGFISVDFATIRPR